MDSNSGLNQGQSMHEGNAKPKKVSKPNNVFTVPTGSTIDFFKWWCIFLKPFISLTEKEIELISCFLKHRYELSKSISDVAVLDTMVMSDDVKKKVIEECKVTVPHFYVLMSALRKKKVIKGNVINPMLIPNTRETDNGVFQLMILFKNKL